MIQYDENILQKTADDLYRRADHLVRNYTAAGALAGVAVASTIIMFGDWRPYALLFSLIGGFYGRFQANKFSYELRFQAQMLLCQMQIERNTRLSIQAPYDAATQLQARMMAQNPKAS